PPSVAVPPPGGSPLPSGGMLISQVAISAGLTSRPRLGPAKAVSTTHMTAIISTKVLKNLQVDIADLSFRAYAPGLNRIVMIHIARRVLRSPLFTGGLDVPLLIGGPALQQHGTSIPLPRQSEPG